jgi:hypothetical protein
MLWTIGLSLFMLWLLGFLRGYTGSGSIYILLAAAIVFIPIEIIGEQRRQKSFRPLPEKMR